MLRKNITAIFGISLVLTGWMLDGCATKDPDRYYNDREGFSMKFPAAWEKKEGFLGTKIIAWVPRNGSADQFREDVNVTVDRLPKALTLDEYFQQSLINMKRVLTDFQDQEKGQGFIDDYDAKWMVYTHRLGGSTFKVLAYMIVKDDRGYVITCTALPDRFYTFRSQFEDIARSFQFE
ncbi:MAG: DcrB-related protein [Bacteroidota bacterium]|jgi:hypothetical protein